mmetsp:Transcript_48204/g.94179  ORF Transcript_48204/g.94179 Transcript_48204/m.94179 type:complete len:387 (-) Transcript_48204:42-1202(-)
MLIKIFSEEGQEPETLRRHAQSIKDDQNPLTLCVDNMPVLCTYLTSYEECNSTVFNKTMIEHCPKSCGSCGGFESNLFFVDSPEIDHVLFRQDKIHSRAFIAFLSGIACVTLTFILVFFIYEKFDSLIRKKCLKYPDCNEDVTCDSSMNNHDTDCYAPTAIIVSCDNSLASVSSSTTISYRNGLASASSSTIISDRDLDARCQESGGEIFPHECKHNLAAANVTVLANIDGFISKQKTFNQDDFEIQAQRSCLSSKDTNSSSDELISYISKEKNNLSDEQGYISELERCFLRTKSKVTSEQGKFNQEYANILAERSNLSIISQDISCTSDQLSYASKDKKYSSDSSDERSNKSEWERNFLSAKSKIMYGIYEIIANTVVCFIFYNE